MAIEYGLLADVFTSIWEYVSDIWYSVIPSWAPIRVIGAIIVILYVVLLRIH